MAKIWAHYLEPLVTRTTRSISEDVLIGMAEAIGGNIPLCLIEGKVMMAATYTEQNMMKCLSVLLPVIFNVAPVSYSQKIHDWLVKKQASGKIINALGSFGIQTVKHVTDAVSKIAVPVSATVDFDLVGVVNADNVEDVSWATFTTRAPQ